MPPQLTDAITDWSFIMRVRVGVGVEVRGLVLGLYHILQHLFALTFFHDRPPLPYYTQPVPNIVQIESFLI